MNRLRAALALACLAGVAFWFAPAFRPREIRERLAVVRDPGFAFDASYRPFLEALARSTPADATVAVFAPATSDFYLTQAAFQLAPRRIVGRALSGEARFVAVYRRTPGSVPASAVALPGGFLLKR